MLPSCGAPQPRPRPRHSRTATPRVAGGQGRDWVVAGAEATQRMSLATSSPHPPSAPSLVLITDGASVVAGAAPVTGHNV